MASRAEPRRSGAVLEALARLDRLLEPALGAVERVHGAAPGSDPHRGLYVSPADARRLLEREPGTPLFGMPAPGAGSLFADFGAAFGLSTFDLEVVVLALAPELDLRYERLYAYLQDDITRKRPTVDLALDLLCRAPTEKLAARARFAPDAPLQARRVLRLLPDPAQLVPPLLAHAIVLDEQIVRMLAGVGGGDSRLAGVAELVVPEQGPAGDRERALTLLARQARSAGEPLLFSFEGPHGSGRRRAALALARALDRRLLVVDLARIGDEPDRDRLLPVAFAESQFRGAIPFLTGLERMSPDSAPRVLQPGVQPGVAIVAATERPPWLPPRAVSVPFGPLPHDARLERWRSRSAAAGADPSGRELEQLAARFRLTAGQIDDAVAAAVADARWRGAREGRACPPTAADLYAGARARSAPRLGQLAAKVEPRRGFRALVLPEEQLAQLRAIVAEASHRHVVYGAWGFGPMRARGTGVSVLFSGPPGTGKTFAAEVIAYELGLDLFKIELSQIVSKYIGETERNLAEVFREAAGNSSILFFDEADALFGKRAEVRDARDRYANIEVAYLLQKMEEHEGIVVLATNVRQHVDDAFLRRVRHVVEFPEPDETHRRRIWEVTIPDEAPLDEDVDLGLLAREIELPGGHIRNITLAAAFAAASNGGTIGLEHLANATRQEFLKLGRAWAGLPRTAGRPS